MCRRHFFMYKILNLGNATGLIAGVVFLINGVFAGKVNVLLTNLWRSTLGRVLLSAVFSVIILAVPAKTHWWLFSTYFVREWYGVIYEWTGMGK